MDTSPGKEFGTGMRNARQRDALALPDARPGTRPPGHSIRAAELLQHRLVVHPALAYLHPQLEKSLALEPALHVPARGRADGLELGPALADHDGLLAIALHPDHRVDLGNT